MAAVTASFQQAEKDQAFILRGNIEGLSLRLNSPIPTAKNQSLQEELVKADKLFRATIQKSITTISSHLQFLPKFYTFMIEKIAPFGNDMQKVPPETQKILMELSQENARLTQQTRENDESFKKIERFIQLLSTQENPDPNVRAAFWNWADQLKN